MWRVVGNITEAFVYSAVYIIIVLVATKIMGSVFASDFEKKISEENNLGLALICAALFIGLALLLSSVIR